jgi:thiol-disulfide isomerase/thioredoxin
MPKLIVCCLILLISCSTQGQNATVNIVIEGTTAGKIYCSRMSDELTVQEQDSLQPVNGRLTLRAKGPFPVVYNFFSMDFALNKTIIVLADTGTTTVHIHTTDWGRYRVTGNPAALAWLDFEKEYEEAESIRNRNAAALPILRPVPDTVNGKPTFKLVETLGCYLLKVDTVNKEDTLAWSSRGKEMDYGFVAMENNIHLPSGKVAILHYGDSSYTHVNRVAYKYLLLNKDSEVGALIAYRHFADRNYTSEVAAAWQQLGPAAQNSRFGLSLKNYITLHTLRKAGDFTFRDLTGREMKLSSLKSRYVLVHFWASWCVNCRPENKALASLYQQTTRDQLEYVNISLDVSKADWTKAIKQDGLPGWHTSDLKGFDTPPPACLKCTPYPPPFYWTISRTSC